MLQLSPYMQIKRAFRNLASKEHPDKGGDLSRFRRIQEAYEILSSTEKVSKNYYLIPILLFLPVQ